MAANSLLAGDGEQLRACADLLAADPVAAAARLREFLKHNPLNAEGYRLLAAATAASKREASGTVVVSATKFQLVHVTRALQADDLETAEIILRPHLRENPADAHALRLLADFATRLGGYDREAEQLLRLVLEIEPDFDAARLELARMMFRREQHDEGLQLISEVLARNSGNHDAQVLKAAILVRAGRFDEALAQYQFLLDQLPRAARLWTAYGQVLKTVGRTTDGIEAFRRAIAIAPTNGEAWWSLSDLKTIRLDAYDTAAVEAALADEEISEADRFHLHFALGKAHEDAGAPEKAFAHYAEGNRQRRRLLDYDPDEISNVVDEVERRCDSAFFAARDGHGDPRPDPIFIVGMPRAGSTLIEQILSSHPLVEGTMELPDMMALVRRLANGELDYVQELADLELEKLSDLGAEYLEHTRRHRKTDRPFFIDKLPNNWMHVPAIQLFLPNARIIDARRHPLACCFSNFKQNFARGQTFSYDLVELGRYYRDYVRMMAHVDQVTPGRVYRLFHEQLIHDPETEIRRLLDHLRLPFDTRCLLFHETDRAVRTASAEQVRQPINRQGLEKWKAFEPWLEPLKHALGPVLEEYLQNRGDPSAATRRSG